MTSEPDSTPRRRPPTIDLTATEVEAEKPAAEAGEAAPPGDGGKAQHRAPKRGDGTSAGGLRPHAVGAAIGALVVAAIACGLWFSGLVPASNVSSAPVNSATAGIAAQLDKIQAELQSRPAESGLASRLTAVEAQTKALSASLAAVNRRLDDIAVGAQSARERADAAVQAAQSATQNADAASAATKSATQNTVQRSDLDALAARIAALENSIKALSAATARRPASIDDRAARAALAAEALRAVVERGAPYQAELAVVKSFGADQNAVAALAPFATSGVPSAADLAHALSQLIASLPQPTSAPSSGASVLARLEDNAKNLVRITPVDAPAGDQPSSIIARLHADASRADIAAALADIARLPQAAKTLVEPWVQKANARGAAVAASRRIAADALTGLASTGTQ